MEQLIIRRSKVNDTLVLSVNSEKVYRVYLKGKELKNGLDYDEVSNYFDQTEKTVI